MTMRHVISRIADRSKEFGTALLNRITGFPEITIRYRGHWRHMVDAHQAILALTEDSPRGTYARILSKRLLLELDR
jgi:hypothetical protein